MKLSQILKVEESLSMSWAHPKTASGGYAKTNGFATEFDYNDPELRDHDTDFLKKVDHAGDEGYKPEKISYEGKNRAQGLIDRGLLVYQDGRFFITDGGKKWMEGFTQDKTITKNFIPSYQQGITGVGK